MAAIVVLAGGKSSRMGTDKLSLSGAEGESLLEAAVKRFSAYFSSVFVSVSDFSRYPELGDIRIEDIYKNCGPMSGLHAALSACGTDVFLVAADMPFSDPEAAERIIELCGNNDICVPLDGRSRYEPLFAYYRKTTLPYAEKLLLAGKNKMLGLYDECSVKTVTKDELGSLWSKRLFLNINYMDEYLEYAKSADSPMQSS